MKKSDLIAQGYREKYGVWWRPVAGKPMHDLTLELEAFLNPPKTSPGKPTHFKNIVNAIWNSKASTKKFVFHPWAERMLENACANKFLAIAGCSSCVSGDTRMLDPLTGNLPTIRELCESKIQPVVQTLNGPVLADVPYLKGREELFEFKLSNGESFKCTKAHRLLTPHGWVRAESVTVASELFGYAPDLPATTLGSDFSTRKPDARHCFGTVADSRSDYSPCFHLYGEQLRAAQAAALSAAPSPDDAQRYTGHVSFVWDDLSHAPEHTHPHLLSAPSTRNDEAPSRLLETLASPRDAEEISSPHSLWCQPPLPFQLESGLPGSFGEPVPHFDHRKRTGCDGDPPEVYLHHSISGCEKLSSVEGPFGQQPSGCCLSSGTEPELLDSSEDSLPKHSLPLQVSLVVVESIQSVGVHDFYDLNVPVEHHYFAEGAIHHNSGKSEFGAIWGIVNFLAAPSGTKVLVTSTSLKDSRQRIWGSVEEYWQAAAAVLGGEQVLPGELVSASGMIRYRQGNFKSDRQGLVLIAGEKSKANEAMGKLIGYKGSRVILICDELPELSEKLLNAAEANLYSNPDFSMLGIGNPNSHYDPFGVFSTPKNGWGSIHSDSEEWETVLGKCIRFDGEKSPNILLGEDRYPWMMTARKLADFKSMLGETTQRYARFVKGWFHETGVDEGVFSEADIIKYRGDSKTFWKTPPDAVAGFDPAFTNGGDDSFVQFGKFGEDKDGNKVLEWGDFAELQEDRDIKDEPRTHQIIRLLRAACEARNVHPKRLAIDGTGAGKPFCDVVRSEWSGEFLEVNFSGQASNLPASGTDPTPSKDRYINRVSEIWFSGREYLQSGQIRGIYPALAKELCARKFENKQRGKVQVEPKKDMKARIGKSPDRADAALLCLELCRSRLGLSSKLRTRPHEKENSPARVSAFKAFSRKFARMRAN
jgi:hypothetical protein